MLTLRQVACLRGQRLLFEGLDLALAPGEAAVVTGANGAGKSSLLRIAAGLLRPAAGRVERQGGVALDTEAAALDRDAPLADALAFWARLDGAGAGAAEQALAALDLPALARVPVRLLSSGQRRRAGLARLAASGRPIWRGALLPVIFFLLVATLFPFAVGPDRALLGRAGGGALWMAALLAALLPIERLVAPDARAGVLDQLAVRGLAAELVAAAKLAGHWLAFGPPLMAAALPAAALLGLDGAALLRLEAGLALGTPGLAALGLGTAALTAGLRGTAALGGLLLLPLAVPLLIFGAGAIGGGGPGALKLLAATSLLLAAGVPFVAGAALRAARE